MGTASDGRFGSPRVTATVPRESDQRAVAPPDAATSIEVTRFEIPGAPGSVPRLTVTSVVVPRRTVCRIQELVAVGQWLVQQGLALPRPL